MVHQDRDAALEAAWAELEARPNKYTDEELMRYVPEADRTAWHTKAMDAAAKANLRSQWCRKMAGFLALTRLAAMWHGSSACPVEGVPTVSPGSALEPRCDQSLREHTRLR